MPSKIVLAHLFGAVSVVLARTSFHKERCCLWSDTLNRWYGLPSATQQACNFIDHSDYESDDEGWCHAKGGYGIVDECFSCLCWNGANAHSCGGGGKWGGATTNCGHNC
ncbi:uncharacterized protein MYCGRDRAFT_108482 [Zymoseptoria tritici IPO323]|uniref:Uncharacterized protein n=1 Tax=Zymoseptoria tritici (strain CBS 115943 / IPO323) TaxID=336722 RepID=F9X7P7_ZYMTI|nr:uncharacterized protein MYCGRDRAFT_108482 [Zymoseptoria tritici IPO323]EGP88678.1 hypothetical protein MYCGRDRAFT_108482 [Zymoseptoria tritici IPO323]